MLKRDVLQGRRQGTAIGNKEGRLLSGRKAGGDQDAKKKERAPKQHIRGLTVALKNSGVDGQLTRLTLVNPDFKQVFSDLGGLPKRKSGVILRTAQLLQAPLSYIRPSRPLESRTLNLEIGGRHPFGENLQNPLLSVPYSIAAAVRAR